MSKALAVPFSPSSLRFAEQAMRFAWAWSAPALWLRAWEAQMKIARSFAPAAKAAPAPAPAPVVEAAPALSVSELMIAEEPEAEDIAPLLEEAHAAVAEEDAPATSLEELTGDDLTLIEGVGPATARRLHERGLRRFADVAALSPEEIIELRRSGRLTLSVEQAEAIRASAAGLAGAA